MATLASKAIYGGSILPDLVFRISKLFRDAMAELAASSTRVPRTSSSLSFCSALTTYTPSHTFSLHACSAAAKWKTALAKSAQDPSMQSWRGGGCTKPAPSGPHRPRQSAEEFPGLHSAQAPSQIEHPPRFLHTYVF